MTVQNPLEIKEKIILAIKYQGPVLPVHISKQVGLSILFASAFLSELLSEKRIKISHIRVGSSPLYFTPGQEYRLENFAHHLKSKEKDAFVLLKEKKFLKDSEQEPAIRVALRAIKDFAVAFKKGEEIFWRYFMIPETEFKPVETKPEISVEEKAQEVEEETKVVQEPERITLTFKTEKPSEPIKEKPLKIFDKPSRKKEKKKTPKKKLPSKKTNEKFFNAVKEFLSKKSIEISDVEGFSKNEMSLRIKVNDKEKLLVAYNKKRITEDDIIKAHKKATELNLDYTILNLGDTPKKINSFIEAVKKLSRIDKLE